VARVIARPFVKDGDKYVRTSNRRDFSRKPVSPNVLTIIRDNGQEVYGIGKIEDIFAGVGITRAVHTKDNQDGMDKTIQALDLVERGLIFTNLVEFDSVWGHRRDVGGYARGLAEFDLRLREFLKCMKADDTLIITADHGCDPTFRGTDHTREYVPLIMYGSRIPAGTNLGTLSTFADSGATALALLGIEERAGIGTKIECLIV
jgi:phosphopentomutase